MTKVRGKLAPVIEQIVRSVTNALPNLVGLHGCRRKIAAFAGTCGERLDDEIELGSLGQNRAGAARRIHRRMALSRQGDESSGQAAIERPRRKGRHAGGLHTTVEGLVVSGEPFVVGAITRLVN